MQRIRPRLCTDLIVPLLLPVLTLLLLLALPNCQVASGQGQWVAGCLSVPAGPRRALDPLQEPHQQGVRRKLLHSPGWDGGATLWAQQLGQGCLLSLQAGHTESVLAGQDLGRRIQPLGAQRTLQQGHESLLLHVNRASSVREQGLWHTWDAVIHHTGRENNEKLIQWNQTMKELQHYSPKSSSTV